MGGSGRFDLAVSFVAGEGRGASCCDAPAKIAGVPSGAFYQARGCHVRPPSTCGHAGDHRWHQPAGDWRSGAVSRRRSWVFRGLPPSPGGGGGGRHERAGDRRWRMPPKVLGRGGGESWGSARVRRRRSRSVLVAGCNRAPGDGARGRVHSPRSAPRGVACWRRLGLLPGALADLHVEALGSSPRRHREVGGGARRGAPLSKVVGW